MTDTSTAEAVETGAARDETGTRTVDESAGIAERLLTTMTDTNAIATMTSGAFGAVTVTAIAPMISAPHRGETIAEIEHTSDLDGKPSRDQARADTAHPRRAGTMPAQVAESGTAGTTAQTKTDVVEHTRTMDAVIKGTMKRKDGIEVRHRTVTRNGAPNTRIVCIDMRVTATVIGTTSVVEIETAGPTSAS